MLPLMHLLVITRDTRSRDREKSSGQTHLLNILNYRSHGQNLRSTPAQAEPTAQYLIQNRPRPMFFVSGAGCGGGDVQYFISVYTRIPFCLYFHGYPLALCPDLAFNLSVKST